MSEKTFYALFDRPTPQNLEANRRGRLTLEQQSALERAAKGQRSLIMFWIVMILAIVSFMGFFLWQVAGMEGLLSIPSIMTFGLVALGAVVLVWFLPGGDALFVLSHDEIEDGLVESVTGSVAWMGSRYRMVSDARKLKSMRSGRALPPPGDYRFYCLPDSGLVVMAEELGLISASQPEDLLLDALARANHFSMEDLQTNREGSLSSRQELLLLGYASLLGTFILISVLGVVLAIQGQILEGAPTTLVLIGAIGLILLLRVIWSVIRIIGDLWEERVNHTDGQVTRHVHHARNSRYYTYQLNGFKFRVSLSAYNALIEGKNYRVYFAPRTKRLMAIEPL